MLLNEAFLDNNFHGRLVGAVAAFEHEGRHLHVVIIVEGAGSNNAGFRRGFAHVAAPSLPLNGMRELPLGVSSWVVSSAGEGDSDMDAATVYAHFLRR
jgi:hypothetical protein